MTRDAKEQATCTRNSEQNMTTTTKNPLQWNLLIFPTQFLTELFLNILNIFLDSLLNYFHARYVKVDKIFDKKKNV